MTAAVEGGESFAVEGMIVRVRKGRDKNSGKLWTIGVLGERGYLRSYVFDSRVGPDCKAIVPGAYLGLRMKRIGEDGACLADSAIRVLSTPQAGNS